MNFLISNIRRGSKTLINHQGMWVWLLHQLVAGTFVLRPDRRPRLLLRGGRGHRATKTTGHQRRHRSTAWTAPVSCSTTTRGSIPAAVPTSSIPTSVCHAADSPTIWLQILIKLCSGLFILLLMNLWISKIVMC